MYSKWLEQVLLKLLTYRHKNIMLTKCVFFYMDNFKVFFIAIIGKKIASIRSFSPLMA